MNRANIDKIAQSPEDKLLLAKVWDKLQNSRQKNIPGYTCFLSPRELELTRYLLGNQEDIFTFGGYEGAERNILVYLPDYLQKDYLMGEDSPIVCLRATFFDKDVLSPRDF